MTKVFNYLVILVICLGWSANGLGETKTVPKNSSPKGQTVYWYERGVKKYAWMALDEMVVFKGKGVKAFQGGGALKSILHPQAQVMEETDTVAILKSPEPIASGMISQKLRSFSAAVSVKHISPVFYNNSSNGGMLWKK